MDVLLAGRGLRRKFGNFWAVNGVDIDLEPGKITGLIGPNGAGKTTLLLLLAGMLAPTAGTITVDGNDYRTQARSARAQVGWLPDAFGSWGELKVKEILYYFARLYGLDAHTATVRANELLETVHLTDVANKFAHVLSRGQKQRLGLARTLLSRPKVLLLDEPASGMDPGSRIELRGLLRQQANAGVSVLISSHILTELQDVADDSIFMQKGRVVELDTLQDSATCAENRLTYRFTVLDSEKLHALIGQDAPPELRVLSPHTGELNVRDEAAAATWLRRLVTADVGVTSFIPTHHRLEELYLRMEGTEHDREHERNQPAYSESDSHRH